MIEKITKLHGIGTLHAPLQSGPLEFKNKVVFFAEKGRGKTILVAILRSLASGDVSPLLQGKSINGTHPRLAQVLINRQPHDLSNGRWTRLHPSLSIFDAAFINENIYRRCGRADHRKNLLTFALGEEGVRLAHKVDELAASIFEQRKVENKAQAKHSSSHIGNNDAGRVLTASSRCRQCRE